MFRCLHCTFSTRFLHVYLKHHAEIHVAQHKFKCPVPECFQEFSSLRTTKLHLRRKHHAFASLHLKHRAQRHLLDVDGDNNIADGDNDEVNNDATVPAPAVVHEPTTKEIVATKLLSLRELNKVPSSVTSQFASELAVLIDKSTATLARNIQNVFLNDGLPVPVGIQRALDARSEVAVACEELDSQRKLEGFAAKNLHVVEPVELSVCDGQTIQYVPIRKSLQNFVGIDAVFNEIVNRRSTPNNILTDIIDGNIFRSHAQNNKCLQLILYFDEFTVTNPLRQRSRKYKLLACYLTLANLKPEHRFQDKSILLILLAKSIIVKQHGLETVCEQLVKDLRTLITEGIDIEHTNKTIQFQCRLFCVVGDNLSQHQIGGFLESFTANSPCRFCTIHRDDLRQNKLAVKRTIARHDEQVRLVRNTPDLASTYGVKSGALFRNIGHWHCIGRLPSDIAHDIFEGVATKVLQKVISHCLEHNFVDLQTVNQRLTTFEFKASDKRNKPSKLLPGPRNTVKVKQTFSQTWCLVRLLPIVIGDLVPEDDEAWKVLLQFLHVLEWICSPSLRAGHVLYLDQEISNLHDAMRCVFQNVMTPKEHYLYHYKDQILDFGPLRNIWTFRLESKHQYFLDVVKLNRCHKNICKSLARRHQFHQCVGIQSVFKKHRTIIGAAIVNVHDVPAQFRGVLVRLSNSQQVQSAKSLIVGGTEFRKGLVVTVGFENGFPIFQQILTCFIVNDLEYVGICKMQTIEFEPHYNAYIVRKGTLYDVVPVSSFRDFATLAMYKIPDTDDDIVVLKYRFVFPGDEL